jgi:hypoxanthine phosphoribosyltransferase
MYTILLRLANVLLIGVLNGAFVFTADLVRYLNFDCEVDFIRVSSYKGTQSIGSIELNLHLKYEVKGRDVILIDDILDTGLTLHELRKYFLNL